MLRWDVFCLVLLALLPEYCLGEDASKDDKCDINYLQKRKKKTPKNQNQNQQKDPGNFKG